MAGPATEDTYLPSYEELTVPELKVTSSVLKAASRQMGKHCDYQCKEFMLCLKEEGYDQRKCLNEGKEVTRCGMEFFQKMKKSCYEEFTKYWQCVDRSGMKMDFGGCRKQQGVYDKCVFDTIGQEVAPIGYFAKVRVHDSKRPRPEPPSHPYPTPTPGPPSLEEIEKMPDPPELKYKDRKAMNQC